MMSFVGTGARLADADLPRIGSAIGCGEDELHAFLDVETGGGGWDAQHRPKMLFEPHIFYRHLTGAARDRAVAAGVAYAAWGTRPYPKDSYPRLAVAMAIDETAALKAASWGIGQILGENFVAAGYANPQAMVTAFLSGEAEQLAAAVRFIKANHLDDELRAHNWAAFARGYNGPQYAQNGYHTKLAAAFARWQRIRDTPWNPSTTTPIRAVVPVAATLAIAAAKHPDDAVVIGPAAGKPAPETPADVKIVVVPRAPAAPPPRAAPEPAGFWAHIQHLITGA